jgi:hypothetical protein
MWPQPIFAEPFIQEFTRANDLIEYLYNIISTQKGDSDTIKLGILGCSETMRRNRHLNKDPRYILIMTSIIDILLKAKDPSMFRYIVCLTNCMS